MQRLFQDEYVDEKEHHKKLNNLWTPISPGHETDAAICKNGDDVLRTLPA